MTTPETPGDIPEQPDSETSGSASVPSGPAAGRGSRRGFNWTNKWVLLGGGVAGIVAVVVIVAAVMLTAGGSGPSNAEGYLLADTSSVAIVDVAAVLAAPAIPAQFASFSSFGFPNLDPEDKSAWIDAWDAEWAEDFPALWVAIGLEDISTAVLQEDAEGRDLGWIFLGEFPFLDLRDSLEDTGREADTYRDFETWGEDVAILEDRGAILIGPFVQDVLKALDTERGFVDETSVLKQALERAGDSLAKSATTTCASTFFPADANGCDAVVEAITSGDAGSTLVVGTYVFGSASRAEAGVETIEDAIDDQKIYDADLNEIEADGAFVSYEVSIVGSFVGGTAVVTGGDSGPLSYVLEDVDYVGMLNITSILKAEEIPAQLVRFGPVSLPTEYLDEPEDWVLEWEDSWDGWFMGMVGEVLSLSDITRVLYQRTEGGDLGVLLFGSFEFEDIRDFFDEEEREVDTYRDFELWDDEIALLEDRGLIAFNSENFVKDLLRALDTGEGFLEEASTLRAGLYRSGEGLSQTASTQCTNSVFSAQLRSCDVAVEVIRGGDPDRTELSGVYVFSSERRAESGVEDLEDIIDDQDYYDADIERIEAEGEFVIYEVTIHE